jgi:hypothetical protein
VSIRASDAFARSVEAPRHNIAVIALKIRCFLNQNSAVSVCIFSFFIRILSHSQHTEINETFSCINVRFLTLNVLK